ncbi:MAG: recQ, partial [Thermomicrobiales bacterium]|nr:recQ [Thermomicrobiales bacterium]
MQRSSEAAPDAEAVSPMPFHEPSVTLTEAGALPARLRFKLAAWLRASGQFDAAANLLDVIERESGETATLLDERAALALAVGDAAAVRACWHRRLENFPAPSARAAFARALLELGELDEAAEIADELLAEHGELATVQSLAAEIALQQGDLATAHDRWSSQLADDPSRIAPLLAMTRIALLGGDLDQSRSLLSQAIADPAGLTAAQLASAAALTEFLAQPARSQLLRLRFARLEAERAAALAAEVDAALGRASAPQPNGRQMEQEKLGEATPSDHREPRAAADSAPELQELTDLPADEPLADTRVLETLRDVFGHDGFLQGQTAVINRVLAGADTLAILPTGAGKSLTFQLPSLLLPG